MTTLNRQLRGLLVTLNKRQPGDDLPDLSLLEEVVELLSRLYENPYDRQISQVQLTLITMLETRERFIGSMEQYHDLQTAIQAHEIQLGSLKRLSAFGEDIDPGTFVEKYWGVTNGRIIGALKRGESKFDPRILTTVVEKQFKRELNKIRGLGPKHITALLKARHIWHPSRFKAPQGKKAAGASGHLR